MSRTEQRARLPSPFFGRQVYTLHQVLSSEASTATLRFSDERCLSGLLGMSYWFSFDSKNGILRGQIEGEVTDKKLKEFYEAARELAVKTSPRAAIADFTAVSGFNFGRETLLDLAKFHPVLSDPNLPRVILVPSIEGFGLARIFQHEVKDKRPNVHVVHTLSEACTILGVHRPEFKAIRLPSRR